MPEAKPKAEKKAATSNVVNKYAEVRLAKKKQRRKGAPPDDQKVEHGRVSGLPGLPRKNVDYMELA